MANKKPKFLKNLLTTASAIAVIAGGLSSAALAVDYITDGVGVGTFEQLAQLE